MLSEAGLTLPLAAPTPSGVQNTFIPASDLFSQEKPKKGNGKAWGHTPTDIHGVL